MEFILILQTFLASKNDIRTIEVFQATQSQNAQVVEAS